MGITEKAGEAVLDLAKNEGIQEKVTNLFGLLCPYLALRKEAIDLYAEEIKKSDLSPEAKVAALLNTKQTIKKLKNQKSIADIAARNAKPETDFSEKSGVDEEWFDRYMESGSYVTSEEMQLVWGKILANEFEEPGSTPRNMTRILSEFTKTYAEAFRKICSMKAFLIQVYENDGAIKAISATERIIVPFNESDDYMNGLGLPFDLMNELENLGVIKFDTVAGFATTHFTAKKVLIYALGKVIEVDSYSKNQIPIGSVLLTDAGRALEKITELYPIDANSYHEVLKDFFQKKSMTLSEKINYSVQVNGNQITVSKKHSDI